MTWKAMLISVSDMDRCPITSWSPEHYNQDGSCKCVCRHCKRPVFLVGDELRLVYVEYERTWLCDALDMESPHAVESVKVEDDESR